jgi:hypothetical protein
VTEVLKGLRNGLDFLHRKYYAVAAKNVNFHRFTEKGIPADLGDFKASSITLNSDRTISSALGNLLLPKLMEIEESTIHATRQFPRDLVFQSLWIFSDAHFIQSNNNPDP